MGLAEYNIVLTALFVIVGTAFGSFFNVLIYRLPLEKSVIHPGSSCPHCGHLIKWYENIPILSYLFLKGKCSSCKKGISFRYPMVELVTGGVSLLVYFLYIKPVIMSGDVTWIQLPEMIAHYLTFILIIPVSLIDFEHYIIPDEISLGGLAVGVIVCFIPGGITPLESLYGVLAGGGSLWVMGYLGSIILKKEAMGDGDVKMMAWFGALFGPAVMAGTIFLGSIVGIFIHYGQVLFYKKENNNPFPFGPALYAGLFIAFFWGEQVWQWYATTILNLPQ